MSFQGAGIDDLTSLQTKVVLAELNVRNAVDHVAGLTNGSWPIRGQAGDDLRVDIRALGIRLKSSGDNLQEMGRELVRNIEEQRTASEGRGVRVAQAGATGPAGSAETMQRELQARGVFAEALGFRPEDWAKWDPSKGFANNEIFVQAVYDYYAKLFAEHPELQWAGMAKLAGVVVYAGFQDMALMRLGLDNLGSIPVGPQWQLVLYLGGQLADGQVAHFETKLLEMHRAVFLDLAFEHEVYRSQGLAGIENLVAKGELRPGTEAPWRMIASGDPVKIAEGNRDLLLREQSQVLQPYYDTIMKHPLGSVFTSALSLTTLSPIPGGQPFIEHGGNVGNFQERWDWIDNDMLPKYRSMLTGDPDTARHLIGQPLNEAAEKYRILQRLRFDPVLK
jgi:hypothetical protein